MRALLHAALLLTLALASGARAQPEVSVLPGDAIAEGDRQALAAWALAQPALQEHVGSERVRLLRAGFDRPKDEAGGERRRATLFFRNYARGIVHRVGVDLDSGALEIVDVASLVQPSREEWEEAWAIMRREPGMRRFFSDPSVEVSGGFYDRSRLADDPCSRDVCVLVEVIRRRPRHGFERQVVVNLSRGEIAHRNFQTPRSRQPARLTEEGR